MTVCSTAQRLEHDDSASRPLIRRRTVVVLSCNVVIFRRIGFGDLRGRHGPWRADLEG